MPKRKGKGNKKRQQSNKSRGKQPSNDSSGIDYDALIDQQLQSSSANGKSHGDFAAMLHSKIAAMEQSKKRQENAALFKENVILQQMTVLQQQYLQQSRRSVADASAPGGSPSAEELIAPFLRLLTRINSVFYEVVDSEHSLKALSRSAIQQNDTLKKLCQKLQDDKKALSRNIGDIEQREKSWRSEIEGKFQESLEDIKLKIGDHEERYNGVVAENKKLREQLQQFLDYDKKRSSDFELYKEHQSKLDEIQQKEKDHFTAMLGEEKQQSLKLTANLKEALEINALLKARCSRYESKFAEMGSTVASSSQCIEEYKKMNAEVMAQNKALHGKLTDVMAKYKVLNSYNDQLDLQNRRASKRTDTLSELCRKLQLKNKDLTEDLKTAKSTLFNLGHAVHFKSDIKPPAPKKPRKEPLPEPPPKKKEAAEEHEECGRDEEEDAVAVLDEKATAADIDAKTEQKEDASRADGPPEDAENDGDGANAAESAHSANEDETEKVAATNPAEEAAEQQHIADAAQCDDTESAQNRTDAVAPKLVQNAGDHDPDRQNNVLNDQASTF